MIIIFLLVVLMWCSHSLVIAASGSDWYRWLDTNSTINKLDRAMKIAKILGLVFIVATVPHMFVAGSVASALIYFGCLRESVLEAKDRYLQEKVSKQIS
jgi:hypothetical protein